MEHRACENRRICMLTEEETEDLRLIGKDELPELTRGRNPKMTTINFLGGYSDECLPAKLSAT